MAFWFIVPVLFILAVGIVLLVYLPSGASEEQINVEFWFRQLYELWARITNTDPSSLAVTFSTLWGYITAIGYLLTVLGIALVVYSTVRLFHLRKREDEAYAPLMLASADTATNKRWIHIQELMESGKPSEWREAIIESDIMLDDMLREQGYHGAGVGERLKSVERADFNTLNDAWEAHKVRNQIAHEGSSFDLSQTLAQRTIARYEAVFREFHAI